MGAIHVTVKLTAVAPGGGLYEADFRVDTGAANCMAPARALIAAGIEAVGTDTLKSGDGKERTYGFGGAQIEVPGRITASRVLFGPDDSEPILGTVPWESLGIVVDPATGTLHRLPAIRLK